MESIRGVVREIWPFCFSLSNLAEPDLSSRVYLQMGCCFSKKTSPSGGSYSVKSPDPNESAIDNKPLKPEETEAVIEKPKKEGEEENGKTRKEVFVIKHRISHEKSKTTTTTDPEESSVSEDNNNPVEVDVDVDAILIQCGRLSRSNSAAAKTRRYSGSKRSFDFEGDADAEDGGAEEEAERRIHRQRHRGGESPRERRRRTPSRERDDSKSYRSGSRERGGSGSRRVSRSPGRRSDTNPNPNSCAGSGSSVNSGSNRPAKFVSVPATDKSNNGEACIKRITVKRSVASPRSQSPARAAAAQPSPSKLSRKTDHSPYRRNPLGEIDPNSLGSGNTNSNKRMNESVVVQKLNTKTANPAPIRRNASPSRVTKEVVEESSKTVLSSSGTEFPKPQIVSRSRSLRRSRDFDFSPDALLSNNLDNVAAPAAAALPSYTALLLEDIQNFHQKSVSVNVNAISSSLSKACSIVEAVADLNSSTKQQHQRTDLKFTSAAAAKKADLMEPSFEKYVTVKRGGSSLEEMEEQESSGSNSFTGSSGIVQQRQGYSWEPNSAESTDRASVKSNNRERDRSPLVANQEFDPLKKSGERKRSALVDSSSGKGILQATTTRVAAV